MIRFRSIIIVFLASVQVMTPYVFAKTYNDIPTSHKYYEAAGFLTEKGVIEGYSNGEFRPENLINRAEVVAVMSRLKFSAPMIASSLNWHKAASHSYAMFPDVSIQAWYASFVEISYQNKVIEGFPDGYFRPGNNTNFAEALKIILESYRVNFSQNVYKTNKFLYVKQGDWFEKYFTYAYEHNLIPQNKFHHPGQLITRGEFVDIIYRMEKALQEGGGEYVSEKISESNDYKISIPKLNVINLDVNFANILDSNQALSVLKNGLGHYLSPPGSNKKMVLFGHSSGYSWDNSNYKTILREINKLANGDRIYINYKERGYVFEIFRSEIIPASEDYQLVENEDENILALYTCWPPNSIEKRYVVYGRPV